MCEVPIFYVTTQGHTRRVAERIADQIRKHGLDSRAVAIISEDASHVDWTRVRGVAIAAALRSQKHQSEAEAFARLHCAGLSAVPSLFVSVRPTAASSVDEIRAAETTAAAFSTATRWRPTHMAYLACCQAHTQYNWFLRRLMRRVASVSTTGPCTDQHTDWDVVEHIADDLAYDIRRREIFPAGLETFMPATNYAP